MAKQTLNNGESGSSFRGKLNSNFSDLYSCAGTIVADATGVAATDTAAIQAAFTAAGTGGIVSFPQDQTYVVKGSPGSSSIQPRLINGNGSVIQLRDEVASTIAGGSGPYSAGATSIVLTDATGFTVGDYIIITSGTTRTNLTQISNIATNTLTVGALTFESGTSVTAGDDVSVSDCCLYLQVASEGDVEITGLIFDGNSAGRGTNSSYGNSTLLKINGDSSDTYYPAFWIHHNTFQNADCDAFGSNGLDYTKFTDNHLKNIKGSGFHPGGASQATAVICSRNTFNNVGQYTGATSPTLLEYGHVTGHGAIVTSLSPVRQVVSENIVETSSGFGWDGLNNEGNCDVVLANNIFNNCAHGGFRASTADGARATITGNLIKNCGQGGSADTGVAREFTNLSGSTAADVTIAGNVFEDSVLGLISDSARVVVSSNIFSCVGKPATTEEIASLMILYSGSTAKDVVVSGNLFRGPRNPTELAGVEVTGTSLPLNGILLNGVSNVTISGNTIVGFRIGLVVYGAGVNGLAVSGNSFKDQINPTGGTNAHGIIVSATTTATAFNITNNIISRESETQGAWIALELGTITNAYGVLISGNTITTTVNPSSGRIGMQFGSNTGAGMVISNNVVRLNNSSDDAIVGNSFTSACKVINNDWQNGNDAFIGAATTVLINSQAITAASAINLNADYVTLSESAGTYAVTLAAPSSGQQGQTKAIEMTARSSGSVTLALTNVVGGSAGTTATFDAVGEILTLVATGTKWMVTGEAGVTLS